ncbi:SGNH/GDSL hydrolase family protein [Adhaeribacter aquaticus]|uniref:SGNH/GDSL hydrolase family protein n=1 Tax=Adhaeribacter aquaticus TaxID=299567 RepID=UPI0004112BC2|nr:SGNH/GDSL hydrolase family protein [Adhaeribacter aquaticus]
MKQLFLICVLVCLIFSLKTHAQKFERWEPEMKAFEEADKSNPPKKGSIVFTGSSSIRLWENLNEYFSGKNIINRGFGGSQTFEVTHFADRIITPYKPKQVIIYVGDNDLASGKSAEQVVNDFKDLFTKIRQGTPKAKVTFISIKPSPSRMKFAPQIKAANEQIGAFLASEKNTSFIDVYTPMMLSNGKPNPILFRADSLHMTKPGYDIWAKVVKPYLK